MAYTSILEMRVEFLLKKLNLYVVDFSAFVGFSVLRKGKHVTEPMVFAVPTTEAFS
jgi:hypothetical protein